MKTLSTTLVVLLLATLCAAQQPPSSQQTLQTLNASYQQAYKEHQYARALELIQQMSELPEVRDNPRYRAEAIYGIACMQSMLGRKDAALDSLKSAIDAGFTNYGVYATDTDLDSLRTDERFKRLLADIKERLRPKPLAWDNKAPAPPFPLRFDEDSAPGFATLRTEFKLDAALKDETDEYERLIRLTQWTSQQWEHSPNQMASQPDPVVILREAKAGGHFICRDYAIVAAAAARSQGFRARLLNLLPSDVETRSEAHSVAEVWLPKFRKWALIDGQFGIVPELNGTPLNAVELQKAIAEHATLTCRGESRKCEEWEGFIGPNLFYFKIAQDQRRFNGKMSKQLVLVPKGASEPHKFAGGNEQVFADSIYTSNPSSFYAAPE